MEQKHIDRLNHLAKTAKTRALTPEEHQEREQLRRAYIDAVKANLTAHLDSTYVVDAQGNKRKLQKKTK